MHYFSFILLFTFLVGSPSNAQSSKKVSSGKTTVKQPATSPEKENRPIQVNVSTIDYQYKEVGHMNITGRLFGIEGAYESRLIGSQNLFFRGDGALSWGETKYDGGLQDSEGNVTPYQSDSKEMISVFRLLLGARIYTGIVNQWSLYGGFGYWELSNQMQGLGSYRRNASYNYLPVGLSLQSSMSEKIALIFRGEYNIFLSGKTKSHLEDIDPSYPTLVHDQSSGTGFKTSVGASYAMTGFSLLAQLYHQAWDIAESDLQYGYIEPENTTQMTGLSVGVLF